MRIKNYTMKKIFKVISVLTLVTFLGITNPIIAQDANSPATTQNADDNDDNSGKIGLAGLLGLLGLLGLRRRDKNDDRRYTTTNPGR
jgi:MYXO-CTERM domain-containing protein